MSPLIAHISSTDKASTDKAEELLFDHLKETAKLAGTFARNFDSSAFADVIARYHDLGKASNAFQNYIRKGAKNSRGKIDHSTAGAREISQKIPGIGLLLAYAIAGHHARLPNGSEEGETSLEYRLEKKIPEWESAVKSDHELASLLAVPDLRNPDNTAAIHRFLLCDGFSVSFWIRMLFSCLVDADFIATEKFMNSAQSDFRKGIPKPKIADLEDRLSLFLKCFDAPKTELGKIRNEIRDDCLSAASHAPGVFTLSVPTGGGKTLSSLAFALKHAREHGLERVIYSIPFTSIIEQTAAVFREAVGDDAVLEHHCNFVDPLDDEEKFSPTKLLAENWDSPIVVTTNVQLFESLFAAKPSRCRKLHNLAKSVIILDEAQTIPPKFLRPCLRALKELTKNYGATVVICTATQPAFDSEKLKDAKLSGTEIIREGRDLFTRLKRVKIERVPEKQTPQSLAEKLVSERQVLAIVNTKADARDVFKALKNEVHDEEADSVFHLSTNLCAVHRSQIIEKIRKRLKDGMACRVVSTQLIEAGVDVDFPCVFRAVAGIDSIAQAAGRCNREGKIANAGGRVFVFETEKEPPEGFLRMTANAGMEVAGNCGNDLLSPEAVNKYFEMLYWRHGEAALDALRVRGKNEEIRVLGDIFPKSRPKDRGEFFLFRFRDCGENFHLIDDKDSRAVIVPWGEAKQLCEKLREAFVPEEQRKILEKLQRYSVSVYINAFEEAVDCGKIKFVHENIPVLVCDALHYDENLGLSLADKDTAGTALCC